MSVINILSPHVADMIAAGEVVERPASVIKELMENSFDAGAKNMTVEIKGGGATYIRVSDDGCGMLPEDAGVAFLRHATSKLRDERGLECISTMGFRGEALAAISAVSRISLTTRKKGTDEGTLLTLDAGDIQDMLPTGCPEGTTIIVRDIFYNTPARQKFLKSDRSEASACTLAALRCALAHPEVSVRYIRDGAEEFFTPGDGRDESCIYSLLGRETASDMLRCTGENEGVSVRGFVSSPKAGRGNRTQQFFFCNGRFIKSQLLQAAVEQAYKNTLLTGRYPACVIYVTLGFGSVDVNVHPAKTEVKFSDERRVFDAVYYAVLSALEGEKTVSAPSSELPKKTETAPRKESFFRTVSAAEYRKEAASGNKEAHTGEYKLPLNPATAAPSSVLRSPQAVYQTKLDLSAPISEKKEQKSNISETKSPSSLPNNVENYVQNVETPAVPDHKIVGEAMKTYIIVEVADELIFIDKHAAHERMIFDRLKARGGEIMAQALLTPAIIRPTGEDGEIIEKNAELLSELGFEIEPYGTDSFAVRAVPADIAASDVGPAIEEICEKLRRGKSLSADNARDEILHTVACKAAIKAGWNTTPAELERIAVQVLGGRVKYCPHGRPVSFTMTKKDMDKQFKRIV